jgi:hypothetical protein
MHLTKISFIKDMQLNNLNKKIHMELKISRGPNFPSRWEDNYEELPEI